MSEKNRGNENLCKAFYIGEGNYDIPSVDPCTAITADTFISFNNAKTEKNPTHKGVHFFLDDYQFQRVWEQPDKYLDVLARFDCVCAPDFSLYADYPLAVQIYNHYRKMWLSAYYQEHDINVIPTACWSDDLSYDFCFDGMPINSIIAISSTGTMQGKYQSELFEQGFYEMLDRLTPTEIIFFGKEPECVKNCEVPIRSIGSSHARFEGI